MPAGGLLQSAVSGGALARTPGELHTQEETQAEKTTVRDRSGLVGLKDCFIIDRNLFIINCL